ncbi:MAG: DUF4363 family protein [Candidatus Borkfalkiaceae bacterium]|nr:DUF4363 family protein [Christensenellaceae bacterium]
MVKTIISMLAVAAILVCGALYEADFTKRQFEELSAVLEVLYEKTDAETAVEDDVYAVQKNWVDKKKYLHIFIPHNEIKEIDLWLAESVKLVRDKKWEDALSKIEVLKELTEQIPKTFRVSIENIF